MEAQLSTNSVWSAILSERLYQRRRWGFRQPDGSFQEAPHSIEEFVLYMDDYMVELKHQLSRLPEPEARQAGLDTLRKIVTMGVACFEQHGISLRDPNALVVNGRDKLPA